MITHIVYALHDAPSKLRILICEVLAALSALSPIEGHRLVLSGFSEFKITFDETYRFQELVNYLSLTSDNDLNLLDDEGLWDLRTAIFVLINTLTNYPASLEDRIFLREEFGRRGLNEVIVVSTFF